ncbi:MAG: hypothetical protein MZV70_67970 [Desulfobacterales bacterium]|nr:hypothetical protein [Desulfobacterales bacterium]
MTRDPRELLIARTAARAIAAAGIIREGFSLQTGSGGASLAAVRFIQRADAGEGRQGVLRPRRHHEPARPPPRGGPRRHAVRRAELRLRRRPVDGGQREPPRGRRLVLRQSVTRRAAPSTRSTWWCSRRWRSTSTSNVNVITGSDGVIRGASGGHCDTAAGAALTVVVAPLLAGQAPLGRGLGDERHQRPGQSVDLLVTDRGIAVNPARGTCSPPWSRRGCPSATSPTSSGWRNRIPARLGRSEFDDRIVGLVEYRDGTIIDTIRRPKGLRA